MSARLRRLRRGTATRSRRSPSSRRARPQQMERRSRAWSPAATSGSPSPRSTPSGPSARSSRSTAWTPARSPASRSPPSVSRPPQALARVGRRARPGAQRASSPARACSRSGRRSTTSSTRSTGSSCRGPTSPPRRWSPACIELGWEVDDVTAYRTVRAAPPPRRDPRGDQDRPVRRGRLHLVLHGAQPRRHRRQAARLDRRRLHRPGHGQDRRGARPAGRRPGRRSLGATRWSTRSPTSARRLALAAAEAGETRRPSRERRPRGPRRRAEAARSMGVAPAPSGRGGRAGCAVRRACGGWWPRPGCTPADLVLPLFVREGAHRAGADHVDARRRPAHPGLAASKAAARGGRRRVWAG